MNATFSEDHRFKFSLTPRQRRIARAAIGDVHTENKGPPHFVIVAQIRLLFDENDAMEVEAILLEDEAAVAAQAAIRPFTAYTEDAP